MSINTSIPTLLSAPEGNSQVTTITEMHADHLYGALLLNNERLVAAALLNQDQLITTEEKIEKLTYQKNADIPLENQELKRLKRLRDFEKDKAKVELDILLNSARSNNYASAIRNIEETFYDYRIHVAKENPNNIKEGEIVKHKRNLLNAVMERAGLKTSNRI